MSYEVKIQAEKLAECIENGLPTYLALKLLELAYLAECRGNR